MMGVVGLAGCGSDVTIAPGEPVPDVGYDVGVEPGSRLRPVMAVAEGVAGFVGWQDTELGVRCSFRADANLVERCLPRTQRVMFLDSACTEPVIVQHGCFDEAEYGGLSTEPDLDYCERDPAQGYPFVYRRIPGALSETLVYQGRQTPDGFECSETPGTIEPHEFLERGEEVPLEAFVRAERVVVPGSGRLGRIEWQADDGAIEVVTGYDTTYERTCRQRPDFGDGERCVVDRVASVDSYTFVDSACSEEGARAQCGEPIAAKSDGCNGVSLFEIGVAAEASYGGADGVCEQTSDIGHRLGVELTSDDFPLAITRDEGSGRLVSRLTTDTSGWRVSSADWPLYDSELDTFCDWSSGHCVPRFASLHQGHYADPSCTEPLLVLPKVSCPREPDWGWMPIDASCGGIASLHEVQSGLDWMTSIFELTEDGTCEIYPIDDEEELAYQLGPPRSVDSFAPMAIETW